MNRFIIILFVAFLASSCSGVLRRASYEFKLVNGNYDTSKIAVRNVVESELLIIGPIIIPFIPILKNHKGQEVLQISLGSSIQKCPSLYDSGRSIPGQRNKIESWICDYPFAPVEGRIYEIEYYGNRITVTFSRTVYWSYTPFIIN